MEPSTCYCDNLHLLIISTFFAVLCVIVSTEAVFPYINTFKNQNAQNNRVTWAFNIFCGWMNTRVSIE